MTRFAAIVMLLVFVRPSSAQSPPLDSELKTVISQGRGTSAGRAAWDKLVEAGPSMLPRLLLAMNGADTVAANWLRTAFDRIVDRELQDGGKRLDTAALLAFVRSDNNQGRARRMALELVDKLDKGAFIREITGKLDDPEFRYDAVALQISLGKAKAKSDKDQAHATFKAAFVASRDVQQARDAAAGLKDLGESVSVAAHLGFLTDWYLIGPFDAKGQKGFTTAYPPEKKVDLTEELDGQGKKVRWKYFKAQEPPHNSGGRHQALVSLREANALGDADDAVAFAYTEFAVEKAATVEFRGAADDNFTVWVNGEKVFAFEEYRNGVRHDRHRFKANLRAGKNTVLVKIIQSPAPNPEPNWEFFLRVVDDTGRGIAMKNLLTSPK